MNRHAKSVCALAFGLLAAGVSPAPAWSESSYDGLWNVTILTTSGRCGQSSQYPLTVKDGRVSGASDASGSVGPAGVVRVSIRGASANGKLNGNGGSGRWNGAGVGIPCSGRWEASRQ